MVGGCGPCRLFLIICRASVINARPILHLINADSQMPNLMKNCKGGLAWITNAPTSRTLSFWLDGRRRGGREAFLDHLSLFPLPQLLSPPTFTSVSLMKTFFPLLLPCAPILPASLPSAGCPNFILIDGEGKRLIKTGSVVFFWIVAFFRPSQVAKLGVLYLVNLFSSQDRLLLCSV